MPKSKTCYRKDLIMENTDNIENSQNDVVKKQPESNLDCYELTPEEYEIEKNFQVPGTPDGFIIRPYGLYKAKFYPAKKKEQDSFYLLTKVSDPIKVVSNTKNIFDENWGLLIRFKNMEFLTQEFLIRRKSFSDLVTWYDDSFVELLGKGFQVLDEDGLREYLYRCRSNVFQTEITCTGWYKNCFILPNQIIGNCKDDIYFSGSDYDNFSCQGSLDEWKENIGKYCENNHRLNFAVSCAFAAPLLKLLGIEGGGFHFYGPSSCGKTTMLKVASSVCGGREFLNNWRATDNGLEGLAEKRNDTLMILDEISQSDSNTIGNTVYMLANGQGKARANTKGNLRKIRKWLNLFLSTGESDLITHMKTVKKTTKEGQDVRLLSIPAISKIADYGVFDDIYDFESGGKFADYLSDQTRKFYGTPFVKFLEKLVEHQSEIESEFNEYFNEQKKYYTEDFDGITNRAFKRFALVGFAGEKATEWGITGWDENFATTSIRMIFGDWKDNPERMTELDKLKHQVRKFFEIDPAYKTDPYFNQGTYGATKEYWVTPERFKDDVVRGFDSSWAESQLIELKWIKKDKDGHHKRKRRCCGCETTTREYCFDAVEMYGSRE